MGEQDSLKQYSILVLDDYLAMVHMIVNHLKRMGFSWVDGLTNIGEATDRIESREYHLVLVDSILDGDAGLTFVQFIRAHVNPKIAQLPIIMITANAEKKNVLDAYAAGVNSYIVKPFNANTLHKKVFAALNLKGDQYAGG